MLAGFSYKIPITWHTPLSRRIYLSLNAEVSSNGNGSGSSQNSLATGHPSPTTPPKTSSTDKLNSSHQNVSTERLAGYGDQGSSSSKLSEAGREYGVDLGRYLKVNYQMSGHARPKSAPLEGDLGSELMVLTGTSSVHTETVSHLRMLFRCYNTPLLNELRGGDLQGMVGAHSNHEMLICCTCATLVLASDCATFYSCRLLNSQP